MGLDNIPAVYPCKKQGTAVTNPEGTILCDETIKQGGCPYTDEFNKDPMLKNAVPVYGMFGTNCWYRGKYGNWLLDQMANYNKEFPFDGNALYGENINEEQEGLSSEGCFHLYDAMAKYTEDWIHYVKTESEVAGNQEDEERLINDWIYASWWLKFVAENAEGFIAWY